MPPRRRDPATAGTAVRAALQPVLGWLDGDSAVTPADPGSPDEPGVGAESGAGTEQGNRAPVDRVAQPSRPVLAHAVRVSLRAFADLHKGRAVEIRVPPFAAVQCLPGLTHTRGNPPNVIETDARGWLSLVTGRLTWAEALAADVVTASGHRTGEIGPLLPMDC